MEISIVPSKAVHLASLTITTITNCNYVYNESMAAVQVSVVLTLMCTEVVGRFCP